MTWKEFKEEVEKQGVTDSTELCYIDWGGYDIDVSLGKGSNEEAVIT